jgi:cytochrome P450
MFSKKVSFLLLRCKALLNHIALRLYPSVPVNTRTALRTTVLPTGGGPDRKSPVLIPKGTPVAYSVYTLHRRPDLYGMDAELFRPERWDEYMPLNHTSVDAKWGYLPFNGGPRICLGSKFTWTRSSWEYYSILTRRLSQWTWHSRKPPTQLCKFSRSSQRSSCRKGKLWN